MTHELTKQITRITLALFTIALLGLSTACLAETFSSNGYDAEVEWKLSKKSGKLKVWGNVKNGTQCETLKVAASLAGSKGQSVKLASEIQGYTPSEGGAEFSASQKNIKGKTKNWRLYNVVVECQ